MSGKAGRSLRRLAAIVARRADPVDWEPMDPRDRQDVVDGAECAACGRPVPVDATRVLAQRDDLAFVELGCAACGSVSLAILLGAGGASSGAPIGDPSTNGSAASIGADDVLDMHLFLAGYRGDLRGLVGRPMERGRPDATGAA
jgi:hypothetical protein